MEDRESWPLGYRTGSKGMDNGQETPRSFAIPPLEQIDGPEPLRVEPLFRARGGRSEARGEASGPVVREGPGTSEGPLGETSSSKAAPKQNSIVVSPRQRGNPILKFIRNVSWEFGDVVPDYVLGQTTCALYLSLRYHSLNREYIHHRLKGLGQAYALRVLLVHVDTKDPHRDLKELAKISLLADCTLILAWSCEEAGRYLETFKVFESKPSDVLQERLEHDYLSRVTDCLTTVKSVNKTDSVTLINTFKSLKGVVEASKEELSLCPGLGPQKARRLMEVFHAPLLRYPQTPRGVTDP